MADTDNIVLNQEQAFAALGYTVTTEPARGALGQPQVRARAVRDGNVAVVTIRDTDQQARDAAFESITMPARRTRK